MSRSRSRSPIERDDRNHEREDGEERQQNNRQRDSRDGEKSGAGLHLRNLHPRTSEDDIRDALSKFGLVQSCSVIRDPHTQESRCFGFATMSTSEEADEAIRHLDNTSLDGRTLSIQKSRRTEPRQPTPGSYRGIKSQDELRRRDGDFGRLPPMRQEYPAPYLEDRFRQPLPSRYPPSGYAYPPPREIPRIDRYIDRGRNDSRAYEREREPPRGYSSSSYDSRDRVDARAYDSRDRVDTRAYDSRDSRADSSRVYDRDREPRTYDRDRGTSDRR